MTQTMRLERFDAIEYAEAHDLPLCKYADPTEGAREDLTPDEARAVAREDSRLIYLDLRCVGWTDGDGTGHEGYNVADYFADGKYQGADEHGIEPIMELAAETVKAMHTVITTNEGYDSILLVDDRGTVLSAWAADRDTVAEYARKGANASEWSENEWQGFDDPAVSENEETLRTIDAYGTEVGRDGQMSEGRREFWFRPGMIEKTADPTVRTQDDGSYTQHIAGSGYEYVVDHTRNTVSGALTSDEERQLESGELLLSDIICDGPWE